MLGAASAVSGTVVAVGSPATTVGQNSGQGAVLVYTVTASGTWQLAATLTASDGAAHDSLGTSVAIDGDTIVAGAPYHTVAGNPAEGSAYVFTRPTGSSWTNATETAKLTPSDGAANDNFGLAIGVSGSNAAIGSPGHTVGGNVGQGSVYVFSEGATGGWQQATPTEFGQATGAAGDGFGSSVAISGDTLVAGAPSHTVGGQSGEGEAYAITEPSGGPWPSATESPLTSTDGAAGDSFGAAVAISAGTLVVGAPSHTVGSNPGQGAAYVYSASSNGSWSQAAELAASDGAAGDGLGQGVAVAGGTIVAGAPYHTVGAAQYAGEAYVFSEPSSGGWPNAVQSGLNAGDGATNDHLGLSVGVAGSTVVAGAPAHATGAGSDNGGLYIFGQGSSSAVPVNTAPPTISGRPLAGDTLTETHGQWTNSPLAFTYQWEDCDPSGANCTPIAGATAQTYTIAASDVGGTIVAQEIAANLDGSGSPASSSPTLVVHSAPAPALSPDEITVGPTNAAFNGTVNPGGLATTAHYEYGLDPTQLGGGPIQYQSTPDQQLPPDFSAHQVPFTLTDLVPNAEYHVRLVATNSAGMASTSDQTFITGQLGPPSAPVIGESVNLTPVSGIILIKLPAPATGTISDGLDFITDVFSKGTGFIPLTQARHVPLGSQIDARRGTLVLRSAAGTRHKVQDVTLRGGLFSLTQARHGLQKGLTTLNLLEGDFPGAPSYARCPKAAADGPKASPANVSPKVLQALEAKDNHGKYRTKGRGSAATVRGTDWITEDRCDGTLTIVKRGTVDVYDYRKRKTIILHAGQRYLARLKP
jgi:hypothetical protein